MILLSKNDENGIVFSIIHLKINEISMKIMLQVIELTEKLKKIEKTPPLFEPPHPPTPPHTASSWLVSACLG